MPDCPNCISPFPPPAAVSPTTALTATAVQHALASMRAELVELDRRLGELCATLPTPTRRFDAMAEIAGMIACVRSDLLSDALLTLQAAATSSEAEFLREFRDRRRRRTPARVFPLPALHRRRSQAVVPSC